MSNAEALILFSFLEHFIYLFIHLIWTDSEIKSSKDDCIAQKADDLYSRNAISDLYDYLMQYKDSNSDEVLWRLCRAACDKAKTSENKEEKKRLMYEAYAYVQRALELSDKNFASHKVVTFIKLPSSLLLNTDLDVVPLNLAIPGILAL